jgi:hypothetical protein
MGELGGRISSMARRAYPFGISPPENRPQRAQAGETPSPSAALRPGVHSPPENYCFAAEASDPTASPARL